ncbi:MAG: formate/nitrite transporter family protein [Terriglobales bacterium]
MATQRWEPPHEQEPEKQEQSREALQLDTSRMTAHEILEGAAELGRNELKRSSKALAISGLAGGLTMGLTGMAVAIAQVTLGAGQMQEFVSYIFYPVGFIAVIIGRAQLFTENTLFPVVLILSERRHVLSTLRLWIVVFLSNSIGAAAFAVLAVLTGALRSDFASELVTLGVQSANQEMAHIFWTGVIGGWLIALVAWLVTASHWTVGQIVVVWLLTFIVGLGRFAHCIATSGEIFASVFAGAIPFGSYVRWIIPATAGNIVGGVTIVSLLNYGQVKAGETLE